MKKVIKHKPKLVKKTMPKMAKVDPKKFKKQIEDFAQRMRSPRMKKMIEEGRFFWMLGKATVDFLRKQSLEAKKMFLPDMLLSFKKDEKEHQDFFVKQYNKMIVKGKGKRK